MIVNYLPVPLVFDKDLCHTPPDASSLALGVRAGAFDVVGCDRGRPKNLNEDRFWRGVASLALIVVRFGGSRCGGSTFSRRRAAPTPTTGTETHISIRNVVKVGVEIPIDVLLMHRMNLPADSADGIVLGDRPGCGKNHAR